MGDITVDVSDKVSWYDAGEDYGRELCSFLREHKRNHGWLVERRGCYARLLLSNTKYAQHISLQYVCCSCPHFEVESLSSYDYFVGQRVEYHFLDSRGRGKWYGGVISNINSDNTLAIHFDDGDRFRRLSIRKQIKGSFQGVRPEGEFCRRCSRELVLNCKADCEHWVALDPETARIGIFGLWIDDTPESEGQFTTTPSRVHGKPPDNLAQFVENVARIKIFQVIAPGCVSPSVEHPVQEEDEKEKNGGKLHITFGISKQTLTLDVSLGETTLGEVKERIPHPDAALGKPIGWQLMHSSINGDDEGSLITAHDARTLGSLGIRDGDQLCAHESLYTKEMSELLRLLGGRGGSEDTHWPASIFRLHWYRSKFHEEGGIAVVVKLDKAQRCLPERLLFLDELINSSTQDEHLYHAALVWPVLGLKSGQLPGIDGETRRYKKEKDAHEQRTEGLRVLVLGGGEGATAREVLSYSTVSTCVMCEIDDVVIDVSRKHLKTMARGLDVSDPRLQLVVDDCVSYLSAIPDTLEAKFDVIICDLSDPGGPASVVLTKRFYSMVRAALKPGGLFSMYAGVEDDWTWDATEKVTWKQTRHTKHGVRNYTRSKIEVRPKCAETIHPFETAPDAADRLFDVFGVFLEFAVIVPSFSMEGAQLNPELGPPKQGFRHLTHQSLTLFFVATNTESFIGPLSYPLSFDRLPCFCMRDYYLHASGLIMHQSRAGWKFSSQLHPRMTEALKQVNAVLAWGVPAGSIGCSQDSKNTKSVVFRRRYKRPNAKVPTRTAMVQSRARRKLWCCYERSSDMSWPPMQHKVSRSRRCFCVVLSIALVGLLFEAILVGGLISHVPRTAG